MKDVTLIVGTMHGLYLLRGREVKLLLDLPIYGISPYNGCWYVAERADRVGEGRIHRFQLANGTVASFETFARGLRPELHQIDWVGNHLYVTESDLDVLRVFDESGRMEDTVHPHGSQCLRTIEDPDYCRFNSIFMDGAHLYLVAHNRTKKTGKASSLWILDPQDPEDIERIEKVPDFGGNSHNLAGRDGVAYYCDSMFGNVIAFPLSDPTCQEVKFHCNCFTRGLAMTDDCIAVGASRFGERWERDHLGGCVHVLDRTFQEVYRVDLPDCGQIYEIRVVDSPDYSLSNVARSRSSDFRKA